MPSQQQKSAKNCPERYLIFGPNHILMTLRWDERRSPGYENVCMWFFFKGTYAASFLISPSKLRNCVFLGKCSRWNLNFQERCV